MAKKAEVELAPPVIDDPLVDAPRDGRVIELSPDGKRWERAKWYQTRVRQVVDGYLKLVPTAYWIGGDPYVARHKIDFEPKMWRVAS